MELDTALLRKDEGMFECFRYFLDASTHSEQADWDESMAVEDLEIGYRLPDVRVMEDGAFSSLSVTVVKCATF